MSGQLDIRPMMVCEAVSACAFVRRGAGGVSSSPPPPPWLAVGCESVWGTKYKIMLRSC